MISKLLEKLSKKVLLIIAVVVVLVLFIGRAVFSTMQAQQDQQDADAYTKQLLEEAKAGDSEVTDSLLLQMQDDLIKTYGQVPDGYIWDIDGTLLSLGDPDMTAEEVVYAYLNGLRTLDISSAQRYSRDSMVISTYESYFNETNRNTDYTDQFLRNMYREALLSMEIEGIENASVFAENMQVFTVRVKMLDLTLKDFWFDDKMEIYRNLRVYDSDQNDSTRAEMYLYDYISNYYSSDDAAMRETTFDLTVQRYPDLNTGWLVSIDTDIDSACRYADGTLVVSYINEMYRDEGLDLLEEEDKANTSETVVE